jgi:PAS domain S-box-containing protein
VSTLATPASRDRDGSSSRLVLWAGAMLALAVLAALAGLLAYERNERVAHHRERHELLARVMADHTARTIDATALASASLADLVERGEVPQGERVAGALLQTLVNLPFVRGVAILDPQGRVLAGAGGIEPGARADLAAFGPAPTPGADALGHWVAGRGLPIAGVAPRGPAGLGTIPYLRGAANAGGARFLVVALINPEVFSGFQQLAMHDKHSAAALVTFDGRVLAATAPSRHAPGHDLSALPPFSRFMPATEHASWVGAGLHDGDEIAAFRALRDRPLVVLVSTPQSMALGSWRTQARWFVAASLAAVLAITLMTWTTSRSLRARERTRRQLDGAQAAVAARERELSVIFSSVRDGLFRTDAAGVINFVNERWAALPGPAATGTHGRALAALVTPDSRDAVAALFDSQGAAGERHARARVAGPDGAPRQFEITVVPLMAEGRVSGFAGSAVDVTALLEAQAELRTQLAFNAALIESNPLPISVLDLDNRYLRVNRAWESYTGRRRQDVIGTQARTDLPPEQAQLHDRRDRELIEQGGETHYEAPFSHRDGSTRDLFISKALLSSADGQPSGILTAFMDVSEFREAERATRQARDIAESASHAKSEFVANISHELRTPLQSILGFSELGLVRGREQPRLAGMFESIHGAGQRMLALVNDLLDLSKLDSPVGTLNPERHDLRDLVRDVVAEVDPLLAPKGLRIGLELSPGALVAKVDPARYQQVVRNVLANAIRFSPAGTVIELHGSATADGDIHVSVADRGPGIPPDELELIFDAFVQSSKTKSGSGGTGLGLAICRKIVEGHSGSIRAENRPGGGSVFHICVPAARFGDTAPAAL